MARTLQHNRSSTALEDGQAPCKIGMGRPQARCKVSRRVVTQRSNSRQWTSEYSVLRALTPALLARAGTCYSFADWTMAGNGIVVVLANGQEFRMEIVEAV